MRVFNLSAAASISSTEDETAVKNIFIRSFIQQTLKKNNLAILCQYNNILVILYN